MIFRKASLLIASVGLLWPVLGWAPIGFNLSECTPTTPYKDTPAAMADVIFRAKALETRGVDTEMQVIEVKRGDLPSGRVTFKHAMAPKARSLEEFRHYYVLKQGQIYLIYAMKTGRKNVFSQLYREDYCGASVVPSQP